MEIVWLSQFHGHIGSFGNECKLALEKGAMDFPLWCKGMGSSSAAQDTGSIPGPAQWVKGLGVS